VEIIEYSSTYRQTVHVKKLAVPLKIVMIIAFLSLGGCVSHQAGSYTTAADENPGRATVSSYRASVSAENLDENNATFFATGVVMRIGEEQWYTVTDSVTGKETAAIYYRDVTIQVIKSVGSIGDEFNLMIGSDFDPSIEISEIEIGDNLVVAGYEGFERNGVINHGAAYVGLIDAENNVVHSLYTGDQSLIPFDTVLSAYGLN